MKSPIIGIYVLKNLSNGKIYLGSSINVHSRYKEHLADLRYQRHHSIKLQRAWDKYGPNNFILEIIEICKREELFEREQFWLDTTLVYGLGYNCSPFAFRMKGNKRKKEEKQRIFSEETRKRMSEAAKERCKNPESYALLVSNGLLVSEKYQMGGRPSEESIIKIRNKAMGRAHSEETRKRMSEAQKERYKNPEERIKTGVANTGRRHSEETLRKMSDSMQGKNLGKKRSEKTTTGRSEK